jgi:hypothetical protein
MLTALMLVQAGINLALILALYLILRGREHTARLALDREARLEGLAADLCAIGRSLLQRAPAGSPAQPPAVELSAAALEPAPASRRPGAAGEGAAVRRESPRDEVVPAPADPSSSPVALRETQAASIQPAPDEGAPSAGEASERLRVVAALLDRGVTVADVAAQTAIPEGEVEVFRNLRRSAKRFSAERGLAPLRG